MKPHFLLVILSMVLTMSVIGCSNDNGDKKPSQAELNKFSKGKPSETEMAKMQEQMRSAPPSSEPPPYMKEGTYNSAATAAQKSVAPTPGGAPK